VSSWQQSLRLLDWTADGRYLAIGSERTGKGALHLLPIRDGKSAGAPVFIRYGDFEDGVMTAAGGLVYSSVKPGGMWAVHLASLDPNGRLGGWERLDLHLGNMANPWPEWSSDSNQIVYIAGSGDAGQTGGEVVHLHNLSLERIARSITRSVIPIAPGQFKSLSSSATKTGLRRRTSFRLQSVPAKSSG